MTPQKVEGVLSFLKARIDSDLETLWMCMRYSKATKVVEDWKADHPGEDLPEEVLYELIALAVIPVARTDPFTMEPTRFGPMSTSTNGGSYPDVEKFLSEETVLEYLTERVSETTNPLQRARYADLLWEAPHDKVASAHEYGLQAGEAYIEVARLGLEQADFRTIGDALERAFELACQLNNRELAGKVVAALDSLIDDLSSTNADQFIQWLGQSLVWFLRTKLGDLVTKNTIEKARNLCDDAMAFHKTSGQWSLWRDVAEISVALSVSLSDKPSSWKTQMAMAESWELQADMESKQGAGRRIVAATSAEYALRAYLQLASLTSDEAERQQCMKKIEVMKIRVRDLTKLAQLDMKLLSGQSPYPKELETLVEQLIEAGPIEALALLTSFPGLLPDPAMIHTIASKIEEESVFSQFVTKTTIRGRRKVAEAGPGANKADAERDAWSIWLQMQYQLLDSIMSSLKEAGLLNACDFLECARRCDIVDEEHLPFLEIGVERHFAEDYVSAIHVLTPRVEQLVKSAVEKKGVSPATVPDHRIREQGLGDFLRREEVQRILGERLYLYLHYVLVDETGLGLRTEVAHGWIGFSSCNRLTSQLLLFVILLITQLCRENCAQNGAEQ